MDRSEKMELEFLLLEKESIKQFSKENETSKENKELSIEDIKIKVDELVPVLEPVTQAQEGDILITANEESVREENKIGDPFSIFNSEDEIKISVKSKEEEEDDTGMSDSDEADVNDVLKYKFPTF